MPRSNTHLPLCPLHPSTGTLQQAAFPTSYPSSISPLQPITAAPPANDFTPHIFSIEPVQQLPPQDYSDASDIYLPFTAPPQDAECLWIQYPDSNTTLPPPTTPQYHQFNNRNNSTAYIPPLAQLIGLRHCLISIENPETHNVNYRPPALAETATKAKFWLRTFLSLLPEYTKEKILRDDYDIARDTQFLLSQGITLSKELISIAKLIILTNDISW